MTEDAPGAADEILDTPHLADALESDRFKQFLDHIPVAVAVAELHPSECITYANLEFERLTGQAAVELQGRPWGTLAAISAAAGDEGRLSEAITQSDEYIGAFEVVLDGVPVTIDAWSNVIHDDTGVPVFRLVALAANGNRDHAEASDLHRRLQEKDTLLLELQHRVKNNLQMVTALIRLEARNIPDDAAVKRFDRLAGRIEALSLLYRSLSEDELGETVDLGTYLSQIASAVMQAHAVEGIHLDLQVDTWPVSVNVAMPAGLVVNELLTNALKHAFTGREGGTITLHSLVDDSGCRVMISDDGVGLPEGTEWPKRGKLGALIVQSLRQNAKARLEVESTPGQGMKVAIFFARTDAAPETAT
ncbi:histidine kinase dimerization/phosphoacceptor domain -containing protein [uncultured Brevundimonas sp.]|uniref:sensor histidine kinase n=1 Tax=uncultured Brevundimonas sp. TaxID=213418 RepID=UPI0030EF3E6E|tara:strand:+ start:50466 stop:51551 length:1086 start_codon:yes stop_codon:yes gene_type:complete